MKKSSAIFTATIAALLLAGCASTKKATTPRYVPAGALESCGTWNETKTEYTIDLTKIAANDATIVSNADGSITVTYNADNNSFVIPMPAASQKFMYGITKCAVTVSSANSSEKKIAWKLTDSLTTAADTHCIATTEKTYDGAWDNSVLNLKFDLSDGNFDYLSNPSNKEVMALAMCDNGTATKPFTFTVKSIVFSLDPVPEK